MVTSQTKEARKRRQYLRGHAKRMRHEPTAAEIRFWYQVRDRRLEGWKFRRQVPIGPYIADFVCIERKLIVEIDGGQHADQAERDAVREEFLRAEGFRIVRFWNADILTNMDGVIDTILAQ